MIILPGAAALSHITATLSLSFNEQSEFSLNEGANFCLQ
jgi:hypothetical protein